MIKIINIKYILIIAITVFFSLLILDRIATFRYHSVHIGINHIEDFTAAAKIATFISIGISSFIGNAIRFNVNIPWYIKIIGTLIGFFIFYIIFSFSLREYSLIGEGINLSLYDYTGLLIFLFFIIVGSALNYPKLLSFQSSVLSRFATCICLVIFGATIMELIYLNVLYEEKGYDMAIKGYVKAIDNYHKNNKEQKQNNRDVSGERR